MRELNLKDELLDDLYKVALKHKDRISDPREIFIKNIILGALMQIASKKQNYHDIDELKSVEEKNTGPKRGAVANAFSKEDISGYNDGGCDGDDCGGTKKKPKYPPATSLKTGSVKKKPARIPKETKDEETKTLENEVVPEFHAKVFAYETFDECETYKELALFMGFDIDERKPIKRFRTKDFHMHIEKTFAELNEDWGKELKKIKVIEAKAQRAFEMLQEAKAGV